jgi:hypothetical protein
MLLLAKQYIGSMRKRSRLLQDNPVDGEGLFKLDFATVGDDC